MNAKESHQAQFGPRWPAILVLSGLSSGLLGAGLQAESKPGRPSELTLTAKTSDSVSLHWSGTPGNGTTTGYEVLRDGVVIGATTTNEFTPTGLTVNQPVTFRVRAVDSSGKRSDPSNALLATPQSAVGPVAPLRVKTQYHAVVINYDPYINTPEGRVRIDDKYGYRNVDQLVEQYRRWLRQSSGGQVVWTVARRFDLDEFPRAADPGAPTFTAENYENLRAQGYDYWTNPVRGPDYISILHDPRFGLVEGINSGEVDAVWMFPMFATGFWETSMAGPDAYWVNGGTIADPALRRRVVIYGFGKEGHQGVGYMCENTAHMTEAILRDHIGSDWPRTTETRVFATLNLDNPGRKLVPALVNDWTHFTQAEAASWDPELVAPGHSQAGLSHFPPTALYNYDWSTVGYDFQNANAFRVYDGTWWTENGEYRVRAGDGVKTLAFDGLGMRDNLGDYHPPAAFSDGDVEFSIRVSGDNASSHAGFLFRVSECRVGSNQLRGYYVGINAAGDRLILARLDDGYTELAHAVRALERGTSHRVRLEIRGPDLRVYVDKELEPAISQTDGAHITGAFGFTTYGTDAGFANLTIVAHTPSGSDDWYRYPNGSSVLRDISPLEWSGEGDAAMDQFHSRPTASKGIGWIQPC